MQAMTISLKKEFEGEQRDVYGQTWKDESEGRNGVFEL